MDVNKLRELAQKATLGPWWSGNCDPADGHAIAWIGNWFVDTEHRAPYNDQQSDAEFIAAANPAAILELLDRLEAAERDAARYVAFCDYLVSDRTDLDDAFIDVVDKSGINEVLDSIGQQVLTQVTRRSTLTSIDVTYIVKEC